MNASNTARVTPTPAMNRHRPSSRSPGPNATSSRSSDGGQHGQRHQELDPALGEAPTARWPTPRTRPRRPAGPGRPVSRAGRAVHDRRGERGPAASITFCARAVLPNSERTRAPPMPPARGSPRASPEPVVRYAEASSAKKPRRVRGEGGQHAAGEGSGPQEGCGWRPRATSTPRKHAHDDGVGADERRRAITDSRRRARPRRPRPPAAPPRCAPRSANHRGSRRPADSMNRRSDAVLRAARLLRARRRDEGAGQVRDVPAPGRRAGRTPPRTAGPGAGTRAGRGRAGARAAAAQSRFSEE